MTIARTVHTVFAGASGGGSSGTVDTQSGGSTLIVFGSNGYQGSGSGAFNAPTDNLVNVYTQRAVRKTATVGFQIEIHSKENPTVSTTHSFTRTGSSTFNSFCVAAYSGTLASGAYGGSSTAETGAAATSVQPGSVTPDTNGSLLVTLMLESDSITGTVSVDSSYSISDQTPHIAAAEGSAMADLVQGTAGASNPTWSGFNSGAVETAAAIAWWRPAAGGGGVTVKRLSALGVG